MINPLISLETWISESLVSVQSTGLTQDIHVDELLGDDYSQLSKEEVFHFCVSLFNDLVNYLKNNKVDTSGLEIFLNIDLVSESSVNTGKPSSLADIVEQLDLYTPPEIIIYKERISGAALNEFYRTPLKFEPFVNQGFGSLYKEYKMSNDNDEYTRELNLIFIP